MGSIGSYVDTILLDNARHCMLASFGLSDSHCVLYQERLLENKHDMFIDNNVVY